MKTFFSIAISVCASLFATETFARPYNTVTAPDIESRTVLAHQFTNVNQWRGQNAVHASFPQIVEQNFAKLDEKGASTLIEGMSEIELSHLAQLYTTAVTDAGRDPHLLNILSARLQSHDLTRIAKYFGYADVDTAIRRVAPRKAATFEFSANPLDVRPTAGAAITLAAPGLGQDRVRPMATIGQFFDYTPYEIYLSFRTAPVGAMGVSGSLYETGVVLGQGIVAAYATGYAAGSALNSLIETYDPTLYDAIGGTIFQVVENWNSAWSQATQGNWQKSLGQLFSMTSTQTTDIETTGGDFDASADWAADFASGGGGSPCDGVDAGTLGGSGGAISPDRYATSC